MNFADLVAKEREGLPKDELFGLAISGGGIRSATFALGVLQFLAWKNLLSRLHYLSTVSGGGYIGSWLSAWISRDGMKKVEADLVPPPLNPPKPIEAPQISWLRRYGKFLSPDLSFFSADTWLIIAIWSRNTLLNLILLVLFLASVLLGPWIFLGIYQSRYTGGYFSNWPVGIGHICLILGTLLALAGLRNKKPLGSRLGIGSAAAISFASLFHVFDLRKDHLDNTVILLLGTGLGLLIGWFMTRESSQRKLAFVRVLLCAAAGAGGLLFIEWILLRIATLHTSPSSFLIPILLPQLITLLYSLLVALMIGLAGRHQFDERREWWSRIGAWMSIFGLGGFMLAVMCILGPVISIFLYENVALGIATGGLWALITGAGVLLGRSPTTSGGEKTKRPIVDMLLPFAPLIFVTGFLILVSTGVFVGLNHGEGFPPSLTPSVCLDGCKYVQTGPSIGSIWAYTWGEYGKTVEKLKGPHLPALYCGISFVLFVFFGWLFDINEFSLHRFYRNRLVRAYQGASRTRDPDDFTNLDPDDDLKMAKLPKAIGDSNIGPIHLINTAVNMDLSEAGLDERHAGSFVFTPYGCGYSVPFEKAEYYHTYPDESDFRLGTPVTISGAAASPNMGSHTAGTVAFLLTLFNVRLGFWMQNTNREEWEPTGPMVGTFYYLAELFGKADRNRKYVYLSDGGHFENLAVYELLRRRCKYIICIDGEEDEGMKFEGLGELIRKARADLGTEISIRVTNIEERNADGFSQRHCAVADIQYPDAKQSKATLLYLKLSVTGDEPIDVLHYRKLNKQFPHQSTADQFFSESQFESYRALGFHAAETAFQPIGVAPATSIADIFEQLSNFWKGIPPNLEDKFNRQAEAFMRQLEEIRNDKDLWFLNEQFFGTGWMVKSGSTGIPATDPEYTKGFYYCHQLIQLMENTYVELELEANCENPAFGGWMEQFRTWKKSPMFKHTYQTTHSTFSKLFQSFYDRKV